MLSIAPVLDNDDDIKSSVVNKARHPYIEANSSIYSVINKYILLTMSNTDFLGRAIEVVKKAIENDTAGEYEKAYQLYYQSLELFMLALKWEKNAKSKEMIRSKAGEYMERAEKLKNHLAENDKSSKKRPAAVGSNGKVSRGGREGK